jgi:hypothetical protein
VTTSPFLPTGAPYTFERIDQGVDFKTKPGGPIVAPWPGVVSIARPNPGGFGTHYPLIRFTGGPHAGETWYIGHTLAVKTGAVRAGDVVSHTGTGSESWMGNAKGIPGHAEVGKWPPGSMSAGGAVRGIVESGAGTPANAGDFGGTTAAGDAATSSGGDFASDPVGAIVKGLLGPIEQQGMRMLLYVVLIGAGVWLAVTGAKRFAGGPLATTTGAL